MILPANDSAWTNRSEVTSVEDSRGNVRTDDVDSPLNDNPDDNPGGNPNTGSDDPTIGDGSGNPGDTLAVTDQDNADPAKIKLYDLALKKITTSLVVKEGDIVPFYITVYNQGNEPMKNIKVSDYIPKDMSYSSGAGWSPVADTVCYTILGTLNPGDSIALPVINLQVNNQLNNLPEGLYNYAEISRATDTTGVVPPGGDIDSNWDSDPNNDTGGGLFNDDDNKVTGDHFIGEDEDDHDGAFVIVCARAR
jgi:uncharacterized repeat protein (TIGR01451 family)